jgi:hypothetical protein
MEKKNILVVQKIEKALNACFELDMQNQRTEESIGNPTD